MREERNGKGKGKSWSRAIALTHSLVGKKSGIIREGKNCYECSEIVCLTFSFNTEKDQKAKIRKMWFLKASQNFLNGRRKAVGSEMYSRKKSRKEADGTEWLTLGGRNGMNWPSLQILTCCFCLLFLVP